MFKVFSFSITTFLSLKSEIGKEMRSIFVIDQKSNCFSQSVKMFYSFSHNMFNKTSPSCSQKLKIFSIDYNLIFLEN